MKLSFSTKGWHHSSFDDFCNIARDLRFEGIELHNVNGALFTEKDGAFHDYAAAATLRRLYEQKLTIPCVDAVCTPAVCDAAEALAEVGKCIDVASRLRVPYVRVKPGDADPDAGAAKMRDFLAQAVPAAAQAGVVLLLETSGIFSNTARLRDMLNYFACDQLAALWDMYATYFVGGEDAEQTITNLGAYVRHVHLKDAARRDGRTEFCLMGEGDLPVDAMILALRSVNYDGFVSLEWDPAWCAEIDDMEIIFAQFSGYMHQYRAPSRGLPVLYRNKAQTGQYVWKKETLIDCTFSQVLDRMVEEFPDQYAFKYTTLDYTRTYAANSATTWTPSPAR